MSITITGSISGDGLSLSNVIAANMGGGSAGDIPYQSASSTTAFISAGTAGQVLTSNGSSAPSWQTPSGGGGGGTYTAGAGLTLSGSQFSLTTPISFGPIYLGNAAPIGDSTGFLIYNPSNQYSIYSPSSGQLICNSQTGTTLSLRVGGYETLSCQNNGSGVGTVNINTAFGGWQLFALNVLGGAAFTANVDATNEIKVTNTSNGTSADCLVDIGNSTVESWFLLCGHGETNRSGAQYHADRTLVEAREEDLALSTYNDKEISIWTNSVKRASITSTSFLITGLLDLTTVGASSAAIKAVATSDTPSTTYSSHVASTDPAGFIKVNIGGSSRYLPFYT